MALPRARRRDAARISPPLTADELRHGTEGFFYLPFLGRQHLCPSPSSARGAVYLFGAGHVGRALAPVLHYIGFEVTVYDNRAELASPAHFPTAHEIIVGDFRRIFDKVSLTADDYAVVMTPGHQADYEILEQVLRTPATYIGCIGSRKKVALTRERLAAAGFSQQDIDRVHAPIGLPILAETPEEIAISVAAEMIRHRAEASVKEYCYADRAIAEYRPRQRHRAHRRRREKRRCSIYAHGGAAEKRARSFSAPRPTSCARRGTRCWSGQAKRRSPPRSARGAVSASGSRPPRKLGPPSLSFDALARLADYVLVEADGSGRLPLKGTRAA